MENTITVDSFMTEEEMSELKELLIKVGKRLNEEGDEATGYKEQNEVHFKKFKLSLFAHDAGVPEIMTQDSEKNSAES